MPLPSADELEQLEDIEWTSKYTDISSPVWTGIVNVIDSSLEKQWAVKAMHHAETYFKLISAMDCSKLRLTTIDDEILKDFEESFPEIDVLHLDEQKHFKSPEAKEKWRLWINKYEKRVKEFNFGSLVRIDARDDYTEQNTMFGVRMQFYAIEIARNKKGLNDAIRNK